MTEPNKVMAGGLRDWIDQPERPDGKTAHEIVAKMEEAWRALNRVPVTPDYIMYAARLEHVRVRWRGKRMTRKVVAWPVWMGKCPRWAKEQLVEVCRG